MFLGVPINKESNSESDDCKNKNNASDGFEDGNDENRGKPEEGESSDIDSAGDTSDLVEEDRVPETEEDEESRQESGDSLDIIKSADGSGDLLEDDRKPEPQRRRRIRREDSSSDTSDEQSRPPRKKKRV